MNLYKGRNSYEVSNHNEPTFWNRSEYYCLRALRKTGCSGIRCGADIEEKINDHEYESEAEAIRKLAEKPCIILGRCASDILKDRMNVLRIFLYVQTKKTASCVSCKKIIWIIDSAREKVEQTDEERAAYYYEHTGKTWGDVNDYHMILDTSELGVENCADILMHYFEKLEYI